MKPEEMEEELLWRRIAASLLCLVSVPFVISVFIIGRIYGLDIVLADSDLSIALGMNAFVPIAMGLICFSLIRLRKSHLSMSGNIIKYEIISMLALLGVFYMHFHFKCWIPLINPTEYDKELYVIDVWAKPLRDGMAYVRHATMSTFPILDNAYQVINLFIIFISAGLLSIHSCKCYARLLVAMALCFAVGAYIYLLMPSVGPFLYEKGPNLIASESQMRMLEARHLLINGGTAWANEKVKYMFTGPLAAMPSLHLAMATILLISTWSLPFIFRLIFIADFFFMTVESVTSRWHYLIDLPVGIAFGMFCLWLADRMLYHKRKKASPMARPSEAGNQNT